MLKAPALALLLIAPQINTGHYRKVYSGGGITRVNSGSVASPIEISGETTTKPLGFTTVAGHFLVVEISAQAPSTISSVTCSGSAMNNAVSFAGSGHLGIYPYYLANAPACSSLTVTWTDANGNYTSLAWAEYSGMSSTATVTGTAVTNEQAYVNTATWTTSSTYSATAGSLLISGVAANANTAGTFSAASPWNLVAGAGTTGSQGPEMALQDNLSVTSGTYTGTGTWGPGATNYQYYVSFIVGFK